MELNCEEDAVVNNEPADKNESMDDGAPFSGDKRADSTLLPRNGTDELSPKLTDEKQSDELQ